MSMKKILMTAVAVSALSAGAASAASISVTSTVGGKYLQPLGTNVGTTFDAYTIANELNVAASAPTATGVLVIAPTTTTTIGAGNYVVTYNITGGTFTTTGVTTGSLGLTGTNLTGATSVSSVNMVNANTLAFNVTVGAGEFLSTLSLTNVLKLGTARASVAIDGLIQTAGGSNVDGGVVPSKTIIDYRTGYKFQATAADTQLTLASSYKKFTGALTTINIASNVGFVENVGAVSGDRVYVDTAGNTVSGANLLTPVLTLSGDVSAFDPTVGAVAVDALTTNVFTIPAGGTLTALQAGTTTVSLTQKTVPVAGNASAYSLTPVVTMAAGYTAPSFTAATLGAVTLEGTAFYAPWVGDGTNGIMMRIRLGNKTATAISGVTATLLNSLNTVSTTTCALGSVPASGELLITSTTLHSCFGSFGRGDIRITAPTTSTNMTAKMRMTDSTGVTNEQSLGNGSAAASAQ